MATTETLKLEFQLLSPATFGRGDGLPGVVDAEVEHDQHGFPFLRGRSLRGLLAEEMRGLLYVLDLENNPRWGLACDRLLGTDGAMLHRSGIMRISDGTLPKAVRQLIADATDERKGDVTRSMVLESLTAIRRQTAMNPFGAPESTSLRAIRVILRGTIFESTFAFDQALQPLEKALLAASVMAWRRAGTARNRGRGRLRAWIKSDEVPGPDAWMVEQFRIFEKEIGQR